MSKKFKQNTYMKVIFNSLTVFDQRKCLFFSINNAKPIKNSNKPWKENGSLN